MLLVGDQHARQLPGGRGLAGSVDAHDQDDRGQSVVAAGDRTVDARVDQRQQLLTEDRAHPLRVPGALDAHAGAQTCDQLLGGCNAEVRLEQQRLHVLPVLLGHRVAREQDQETAADDGLAAREPCPQPDQPPSGRGRHLEPGGGGDARGRWRQGAGATGPIDRGGRRAGDRRWGTTPAAQQGDAADHEDQDHRDGHEDEGEDVLHSQANR